MTEPVQLLQPLQAVNSGTLDPPTVMSLMSRWIVVWKIATVQTNQGRLNF